MCRIEFLDIFHRVQSAPRFFLQRTKIERGKMIASRFTWIKEDSHTSYRAPSFVHCRVQFIDSLSRVSSSTIGLVDRVDR